MGRSARFVKSLTEAEKASLMSAYKYSDKAALRRRAHAILLSDQGHTFDQISEILHVYRDAVSFWIRKWEDTGLEGLRDKPRSGRTPQLDDNDLDKLQSLVGEHPGGTARTYQALMQESIGKSIGLEVIRRALKKGREHL